MTAEDQASTVARATRIEPLTRLATGGMAEIWLARELGAAGLERFVVTKRLLPHLSREPDIVDMFVSEARFVARLVHPNVVQIHELAEDDQGYFLVMEYVAGCTVRELTLAADRAEQLLPPTVAICIVEQACRGAHAAHELTDSSGQPLGLVHRDISPHNLMIGPGGDVKLLDFGIAKATEAAEATHTGSLKGKCTYMSPEQCRAQRLDRRSDVFALGIVLWELLTGERLFQRDAEFASMEAIVSGNFTPPTAVRPELPSALDSVVAKALAVDVEARWQTADELRRAMLEAAEQHGLRPSRDGLGDKLVELLGDRLEQRHDALTAAASSSPGGDPSALRHALVPSDPSMSPFGTDGSARTARTTSDDIVTVVQRRSPDEAPPSIAVVASPEPQDEQTLVNNPRTDAVRDDGAGGDDSAPPSKPSTQRKWPDAPSSNASSSASSSASSMRRWGLIIALVVLVLAAAAIVWRTRHQPVAATAPRATNASSVQPSAAPALIGPPLRFVVAPTVERDVMRGELAPFLRWLEKALGRPVELTIAESYQHSGELVTSAAADIALLPPLLFVRTFAREPRLQPLALRLYDGSRASDGYLLVRDDAPYTSAVELRGRTVCLADRGSTTGFLLPRIWMRKAGLDPDEDVRTVLSGDHTASLRDLSEGKCDAAAVYSGAYLSAQERGIRVGQLRVLGITGRVPQDVLAAGPHVPAAEAKRVGEALISFEPQRDIGAPRIGAVLGISGFAPFDPADFTVIRQAAEQEGMVPAATADP